MDLKEIEAAIAAEAAAHAMAAAFLNPHGEAETVSLGRAWLVYSGAVSPVHGVFGLGLDGPPDENDWAEIDRFFAKKERAPVFWTTPFTDPSLLETLRKTYQPCLKMAVHGEALPLPYEAPSAPPPPGPDPGEWSLAFSRREDRTRQERDLFSLTKMNQKDTRFYLQDGRASYTFFHHGVALIPFPEPVTLAQQRREAHDFHSRVFALLGKSDFPLLYERTLHGPV